MLGEPRPQDVDRDLQAAARDRVGDLVERDAVLVAEDERGFEADDIGLPLHDSDGGGAMLPTERCVEDDLDVAFGDAGGVK